VYERERGISEWLVRKIGKIYAGTKNKVTVREKPRLDNCSKERKRNEINNEEPGTVCEEEKAGSEC
jgi:hypothetical protein